MPSLPCAWYQERDSFDHSSNSSHTHEDGDVAGSPYQETFAGAKVALCELPRDFISSDEKGGTGGTCVLRGCVPKKLMAIAGLFNEDMQDAEGYGCVTICLPHQCWPSNPLV